VLQVERVTFRPDIQNHVEKLFKKPLVVNFLKRICEEKTQINDASTFTYTKNVSNDICTPRYLFGMFNNLEAATVQTNNSLCAHANMQSIVVDYSANQYPSVSQNADFLRNKYASFYKQFLEIARSLGNRSPGLTKTNYRDLYTIFAVDLSAQPEIDTGSTLTVNCTRRAVPDVGAASTQNPRNLRGYFIILTDARIEIDCTNRTVRRI